MRDDDALDSYNRLLDDMWAHVDTLHGRAAESRDHLEHMFGRGRLGIGAVLENDRANQLEARAEELARLLEDHPREV